MMVTDDNRDLLSVVSNAGMMSYMCQAPPPPPPLPAPPLPQPPPESTYGSVVAEEADNGQENNLICTDYLRSSCTRPMCKYQHYIKGNLPKDKVNFCHDFQNDKCVRGNCKFIHCTMLEEEEFFRTGKLPSPVIQQFDARLQNSQPKLDTPAAAPTLTSPTSSSPPSHAMEIHYRPSFMPPLPTQTYSVPPPPPTEQWMPSKPRETLDYALDMSQRGLKRARYQELGCISYSESPRVTECSNCTRMLRVIAETEEKNRKLEEEKKELQEKNNNLTRTIDLLLDKSTKLLNMFTGQNSTSSYDRQTALATPSPPQPVQRVHILNPSSSGEQYMISSMPSSIREEVISIPAYKTTTVVRPPYTVSGSMDNNVYYV